MATVIVADVHANLAAFEAVLRHAKAQGPVEAIWCLGDIVGYGAEPGECIDLLRGYEHLMIAGNHDLAATGAIGIDYFNATAREAALWTSQHLRDSDREFLQALPLTVTSGEFTLVHGSLIDPVWDYLVTPSVAADHFELQETPYCLVGHSHLPIVFHAGNSWTEWLEDGERVELKGGKLVANPGSVGQPRDGDWRAAYALLTDDALTFHRVEYKVARTQAKMQEAGLPAALIERLAHGR